MANSNFTFRGQRPNEEVKKVVRRHPIVFFWPLVHTTLALALLVVVFIFFDFGALFYIVAIVSGLYIFAVIFRIWFLFSNSFCLITNERVINIDQRGFFDRRITETEYSKIQDVTNATVGILSTSLNFGIIEIQTAGKESKLRIKFIPDPYQVQQEITKNI